MRVAFLVGEGVVAAVVGDPANDRALDGEAAGDGEGDAHRARRLERAMGEIAVIADGDAVAGDRVHDERDHGVVPAEAPAPGDGDGGGDGQQRDDDEGGEDPLLDAGLAHRPGDGSEGLRVGALGAWRGQNRRTWLDGRRCSHASLPGGRRSLGRSLRYRNLRCRNLPGGERHMTDG